jgi:hypothetical protein
MCSAPFNPHDRFTFASSLDACLGDFVGAPSVFVGSLGILFNPLVASESKQNTFRASDGKESTIRHIPAGSGFVSSKEERRLSGCQHMPQAHTLYLGGH